MSSKPDRTLDCLGLFCPEPVFRTRLELDDMGEGQILEVTADDPAAEEDIKRLAKRLGHEVLGIEHEGEQVKILIRKMVTNFDASHISNKPRFLTSFTPHMSGFD